MSSSAPNLPRSEETKNIVIVALLLIAIAQLDLNLIISGFKISMAIIALPIVKFIRSDIPVFPVTLVAAPGILLVRCAMEWLNDGSPLQALVSYAPEMVFYLLYGIMFALYTRRVDFRVFRIVTFLPLVGIDLLSNIGELLVRMGLDSFSGSVVARLLTVALGRSLLAALLLEAFDRYGLFVLQKDDAERYKKLLLLISQLKSEVVWMDKNTVRIEDTMATSYQLYHELDDCGMAAQAQKALTVAKDVHEIKKEYYLIMRGISNAMNMDMQESGMWIRNIFQILQDSLSREVELSHPNAKIQLSCSKDFYTDKHYYLMSIFRNLLNNAVEAISDDAPHAVVLTQKEDGTNWVFQVHDDCGGIDEQYRESIFLPGFSTKISYETGEVSRGLGLNLVRDLVESKLGGQLRVESSGGCTDFFLTIPKANLEQAPSTGASSPKEA